MIPSNLVTKIDHVGIAVADLATAETFYRDAFGMAKVHEEVNVEQGVREAMLAAGEDRLQLLAPLNDDSVIAKFLENSGPGVQQIAFRVTDIRAVCDHLRSQGLRVLYPEPRRGTENSLVNFVHPKDCGGVLIELVQPSSG